MARYSCAASKAREWSHKDGIDPGRWDMWCINGQYGLDCQQQFKPLLRSAPLSIDQYNFNKVEFIIQMIQFVNAHTQKQPHIKCRYKDVIKDVEKGKKLLYLSEVILTETTIPGVLSSHPPFVWFYPPP